MESPPPCSLPFTISLTPQSSATGQSMGSPNPSSMSSGGGVSVGKSSFHCWPVGREVRVSSGVAPQLFALRGSTTSAMTTAVATTKATASHSQRPFPPRSGCCGSSQRRPSQ